MRVTERAQHAVLDAKQEAGRLSHDRVAYTEAKSAFVDRVLAEAAPA